MRMLRGALAGAIVAVIAAWWPAPPAAAQTIDSPYLAEAVASGALPPLAERLPARPFVMDLAAEGKTEGEFGGSLRLLMAKQKDIRMLMVYGYARLVGYDRNLDIVADILESYEVEEGRIFTFHLRPGHRWSDGQPFTAEDFRYYWEDVVNDEDISPFGTPKALLVDGAPPRFEVLDPYTVRYSWDKPNPFFLPALAGSRPMYIYRAAHYLKQFHGRYADADKLAAKVAAARSRNWAGLHHRRDHQYRFDNPDLPVLQPWINTTKPPSVRYVFERNPYYHRIDPAGRQLPYIDRVVVTIASNKLVPAKTGFGESDLQARYLRLDNYTFLKEGEKNQDFTVRLWRTVKGSQIAIFPNLNAADPGWREVLRDVRFRRALSLAIDRHLINQVVYFGLAREGCNTVLPESPLYRPEYASSWSAYDIDRANALLDAMGLTERDDRGTRLLPDGRPLNVIVDTAGESTEETDVLELVADGWRQIGVELFTKPSQREVFRNRVFSGEAYMSVWAGLENGNPTADMSPHELAPTQQHQLQWPKWGQHFETAERAGLPPDMPAARRLLELNEEWRLSTDTPRRAEIWHEMLKIHSEEVFSIGIVNGVLQPVVVNNQLRNVPEEAIYNWDPGAHFGVYKPDTFWFGETRRTGN